MRSTLLFLLSSFSANAAYLDRHAEGWHWYEEVAQPLEENHVQDQETASSDPIKTLKAFQKKVEALKSTAVMNPTFQNVKAYMEIQKVLMDKASLFSHRWQEVLYQTPPLDYTLLHPTSQAARHVYLDQQKKQMEDHIRALSKTHGLFFFFSSKCVYCREFAPIVKGFAQKYGWQVLAISLDGSKLPEFPDAKPDNGTFFALKLEALPALLAVNPQTKQVIPLSFGMTTHDQIEDRIRVLILKRRP